MAKPIFVNVIKAKSVPIYISLEALLLKELQVLSNEDKDC